jgi:hypothetical protein
METIYDKADVDERVLRAAERTEEWFSGERIDWERFWDKLESEGFFIGDMGSPAALTIQKHVRAWRA